MDRVYTIGDVTTQPIDREGRDLDYEAGRFLFAVDPAAIPGYPAVAILSLEATPLPAALRVGGLHVYRMRAVSPLSSSNQNIGGLRAVACGPGAQPVDCGAERTVAADETYLARLGLALVSDANVFDQYNRLFPRTRDPLQGAPVRDYFVVFPHLTPFADPAKLDATERNDSLYRTPRALLATQGPPSVFALRMHASVSASADRGLLSLNRFQIRDGSERIYVGTTLLTRGTDYTIDYATGQVQFRNPDALFPVGGVAQVHAQFEERA